MALSKKTLQLKRSIKKCGTSSSIISSDNWPIYQSLIQADIWEQGIGHVMVSRKNNMDKTATGIYLIDTFCLGIKNCFLHSGNSDDYKMLVESIEHTCGELQPVEASYAVTLIYQAMKYAEQLGFKPHADFSKAGKILKNIPINEVKMFIFGRNSKPCYISGPNDSPSDIKKILHTLEISVGIEGFDYILQAMDD
jgi:hypothetical protein